jgi:catechol 2,3-dioxygenase-like lactoylglutathione lyase family enzyme
MRTHIEKISAITLRVANMEASVRFYRDLLGLKLLYGGPEAHFSSLGTGQADFPILNLEQGQPVNRWGRIIFHVADVDQFWAYLNAKGLNPPKPMNASWGERYFHIGDPDGHELSLARPQAG